VIAKGRRARNRKALCPGVAREDRTAGDLECGWSWPARGRPSQSQTFRLREESSVKRRRPGHGYRRRPVKLAARLAVVNEDRDLVKAAKNGDSAAFGFLCTQSAKMAFNTARRMMRTKEDAEDVVQESLRLAFVHLKSFKGDSRFSTWLTRIVTNAALMRLRRDKTRREFSLGQTSELESCSSPMDIEDQSLNPEQLYAREERHRLVRKAVSELSPRMRRVIQLCELDERSIQEAACMLGISVGAAKSRMFHARRKLRRLTSVMRSQPMQRNKQREMNAERNGTLRPRFVHSPGD
jgi:RNA polymerase sigma-70 factor, ECF subfamily